MHVYPAGPSVSDSASEEVGNVKVWAEENLMKLNLSKIKDFDDLMERVLKRIQSVFKQGPAYKKEGPDPNKGSNQQ